MAWGRLYRRLFGQNTEPVTSEIPSMPSPREASNRELEAIVLANPTDPGGYLVYADWLQTQGDPRGELIAAEYALTQTTDHQKLVALRQRVADLKQQHSSRLFGNLAGDKRVELKWELGFIHQARISNLLVGRHGFELLENLLALDSARFLQSLYLKFDNDGSFTVAELDLLDSTQRFPTSLRELTVDAISVGAGSVANWWSTSLAVLDLTTSPQWELGNPASAQMRHLKLRWILWQQVSDLFQADYPSLERLELGVVNYERPLDLADHLSNKRLPRLEHLAIYFYYPSPNLDYVVQCVANSSLMAQLATLEVGPLSNDAARRIMGLQDRFSHLQSLVLRGHFSYETSQLLSEMGPYVEVRNNS
ncbi:MAG: TIGR02996 domain-containing protein [Proteobacteria bacterium]|nr:TIGR02996 domain-containing protein [Pseudomonadota bacterium]